MKTISRIFSMIMVVVMVFTLAVPAFAADDTYTVTIINPTAQNDSDKGHIYEAYQIFKGSIDEAGSKVSDVQWGANVKADELLTDLQTEAKFNGAFGGCDTAEKVAEAIAATSFRQDKELVKLFASIVNEHLSSEEGVRPPYTSTYDNGAYTIEIPVDERGYYLIKDQKGSLDGQLNKDYTLFILEISSTKTIEHKGSIPTVEKKVTENGKDNFKDDLAVLMGRDYYYHLTGTMPQDIADYDTYKYVFTDTMHKGISYKGIDRVYLRRDRGAVEITLTEGTHYRVDGPTKEGENTKLVITFDDLKADFNKDDKKNDFDLQPTDEIVVVFKARLNNDAVIKEPHTNKVYLEYSNNPNGEGMGKTSDDEVRTYTFKLVVDKYDGEYGIGETKKPLANAEFVLFRKASDTQGSVKEEYAVIKDGRITDWVSDIDTENVKVKTNANGQLDIMGLAKGDYYLRETAAPDGYNKLISDIHITINATAKTGGGIETFNASSDARGKTTVDGEQCIITVGVENRSGAALPSTGGMGTTLFYAVGGAMVIGAIVMLVTKKRMNND